MKMFPPFLLDAENQCLWRRQEAVDDVRIRLTPKAFAVLNYLVDRAGRLISQDELLSALWPDTFVQPEVLKSHILDIRFALGDSARNSRFIETRPKRGYQFIAQVREMTVSVQDHPPSIAGSAVDRPRRKFVDRVPEQIQLSNSLRNCMQDQRQIVFIAGEAGIGKTALVDTFLNVVGTKISNLRIVRGQCVEGYGGTEAYYPVLEALGQLCAGSRGDAVVQLLMKQAPTWLIQLPALVKSEQRVALHREILGATRERMLREIGEALDALTLEEPLILVFEDLHWADPSTVDLISAIARRRTASKLLLIGTYRSVDLSLSRHPLKTVKQDLLMHQMCRVFELAPLQEVHVSEYLAHESGGLAIPDGLAALVHRDTEGNPLFMVAVLDHMRERQLILEEKSGWKMARPVEEMEQFAPDTLRDMIELQIEQLSEDELRVLEVASLLQRSYLSAIVGSAVANMEPEHFEHVCEGLARRHQVIRPTEFTEHQPSAGPYYEFTHVLYKRVVRSRIVPTRRRRLHRRIAETIESPRFQPVEVEASELAHQFEEGGEWLSAIQYLKIVADTTGRRCEPRLAASILERALELVRKVPEADRGRVEIDLLYKLGEIYVSCFDESAIPTFETLVEIAARASLIDIEVLGLLAMALPAARRSATSYRDCLDRAFERSAAQEEEGRKVTLRLLQLYRVVAGWSSSNDPECLEFYENMQRTGEAPATPTYYTHWMYFHNLGSRYREALHCVTEGLATLARDTEQNPFLNSQYMLYQDLLPRLHLMLGDWGSALEEVQSGISILLKNGQPGLAKVMGRARAWICIHGADFRGAAEICDASLSIPMAGSFSQAARILRLQAGCAAAGLADYHKAHEYFIATREEMNQQPLIGDWIWRMPLQWGFTELWLATGDLGKARIEAETFRSCTLCTCERTWQAMAYNSSARVSIAEGRFDQARDFVNKACEVMQGFEVPLAEWRVHATAWELDTQLRNSVRAEHHRELSQTVIRKLADSMPEEEPIRHSFLSSQIVRAVLEGKGSTLPVRRDER